MRQLLTRTSWVWQTAQPEVRRALPIDTVEVRRAEFVVPRAELVRLPGK
jgi:hypothetical protein